MILRALIGAKHAALQIFPCLAITYQRGYIKYANGICYEFNYSWGIELFCDSDMRRSKSGELRESESRFIYMVEIISCLEKKYSLDFSI